MFPVADGTVKTPGGDRSLRPSTLIRDRLDRGEEQDILRGELGGLSSPSPHQDDSARDDAELKMISGLLHEISFIASQFLHAERRIISFSTGVHRRYQNNTCVTGCVVGKTY